MDNEETDVVTGPFSFEVHARRVKSDDNNEDLYQGYVYLGSEIIFELIEPATTTPAGIDDFAGVTLRKCAQQLAKILNRPDRTFVATPEKIRNLNESIERHLRDPLDPARPN